MKIKRSISILLIMILSLNFLFGCGTKKETNDLKDNKVSKLEEQNKGTGDDTKQKNPKLAEMEKTLMSQLEPMPKLNNGEKIGVLVISLTNPYWVNMKECYEKAGKELGVKVEVFAAPTEGDTTAQLETLDGLVVKDYNAIIFSPINKNNLIPGIIRANQSKMPVINLGPGVNVEAFKEQNGNLDGRITIDFENQGKIAAQDMLKYMDNKGKVAIIQGLPGAGQSEGRTNGAKSVFEEAKDVDVVSVQPGDWDRNKAYQIATNLIQTHPDLKGIFACNDVMALAAAEALETAGKRDGVVIYGVDFTGEAQKAIKAGRLDGSITYSSSAYSKAGILLALKIAQGQKVTEDVYSPLVVVNKENIKEFDGWQ